MVKRISIYISINIFLFNFTFAMDYKPADNSVVYSEKATTEDMQIAKLKSENLALMQELEDLREKIEVINNNKEFENQLFEYAEKEHMSLSQKLQEVPPVEDLKKVNNDLVEDNRILRDSLNKYHFLSQLSISSLVFLSVIFAYKYLKRSRK